LRAPGANNNDHRSGGFCSSAGERIPTPGAGEIRLGERCVISALVIHIMHTQGIFHQSLVRPVGSPLRLGLVFSGVLGSVAGPSGRKWTENGERCVISALVIHIMHTQGIFHQSLADFASPAELQKPPGGVLNERTTGNWKLKIISQGEPIEGTRGKQQ
jgi:hypothetical protein